MSTTDVTGDPLLAPFAALLRVPLIQLYAVLWRFGIVDVAHRDRTV